MENLSKPLDFSTNLGSLPKAAISLLFGIIGLVLALSTDVQAQYSYTITGNNTCTLNTYTGGGGGSSIFNIPQTYLGYNVTGIGDGSDTFFPASYGVSYITIPNTVTSIAANAFAYCTELEGVTIGTNVSSIGAYAFEACSLLTSVYFEGNAPTAVGAYVFYDYPTRYGFVEDPATVYYSPCAAGWGSSFALLPTAPGTAPGLFEYYPNNDDLTCTLTGYTGTCGNLVIPNSIYGYQVTVISSGAFQNNLLLTSATIPNSVITMGDSPFLGCASLTVISMPTANSYYSSQNGVLFNGNGSTLVEYPGGGAGNYTIPSSVNTISPEAFEECASLTSVTIPSSVTSIASAGFYGCYNLTGIYFEGNPPAVGDLTVFQTSSGGYDPATIYYPPCDSTWHSPFYGLPASPETSPGLFQFSPASGGPVTITGYSGTCGTVIIPPYINGQPVTSLGNGATINFGVCPTSVTIPNTVTNIGDNAFSGYACLATVTIPSSVASIGAKAFYDCSSPEFGLTVYFESNSPPSADPTAFTSSVTLSGYDDGVAAYPPCAIGWSSLPTVNGTPKFDGLPATPITSPDLFTTEPNNDNTDGYGPACTITSYIGTCGNMIIPLEINGAEVTEIGDAAFDFSGLTSVTMPFTVQTIGQFAFSECQSLASVNMEDSDLSSIGWGAFAGCTSLTSITIPEFVAEIGAQAFASCTSLNSVTVLGEFPYPPTIGTEAFYECSELTSVYFTAASLSTPANDTSVFAGDNNATVYYSPCATGWSSPGTFDGVPTLGNRTSPVLFSSTPNGDGQTCTVTRYSGDCGDVMIPGSINNLTVTAIGTDAFSELPFGNFLSSVTIPDSVTSIGASAFYGCSALASLTIPSSVTTIGVSAFQNCGLGEGITFADGSTLSSIGDSAFYGCHLVSVTIPSSVITIGKYAFDDCRELTSVTLGPNVALIEDWAFYECVNLNSVYFLGNSPPSADATVFQDPFGSGYDPAMVYYSPCATGWSSLPVGVGGFPTFEGLPAVPGTSPALFTTTRNVGSSTCAITHYNGDCGNVVFPNYINNLYVTYIGNGSGANVFAGNNVVVTSITIPSSVNELGYDAFYNCSTLLTVNMPSTLLVVGQSFYGCCQAQFYCNGNAFPPPGGSAFCSDPPTFHFLPGTTGWEAFAAETGLPVELWLPEISSLRANAGTRNGQFGFTFNWSSGQVVVVEACTNLASAVWIPLQTNTIANGSFYFSDANSSNYARRFYRVIGLPVAPSPDGTVINMADSGPGSLRQVIASGGNGGVVTFAPGVGGILTLTNGPLAIGQNLSIIGPGAGNLTLNGNGTNSVFEISGSSTSTVSISGLTITGGNSSEGGGIYNEDILTVSNCIITGNASGLGGGLGNEGTMNLVGCTVCANARIGIYNDGDLFLTNCTVCGNTNSLSSGGGIFNDSYSLCFLTSCTIVSNSAAVDGGLVTFPGAICYARNTIIAGNVATSSSPDIGGFFTSQGFNLVGVTNYSYGGAWLASDQTGSTNGPLNPLVGPLQFNGGPTPTMAPLWGSPVIDQGCAGTAVLDQAQIAGNNAAGSPDQWQSFTAQQSGLLTQIALSVGSPVAPSNSPGNIYIYAGQGTNGALLASNSVTFAALTFSGQFPFQTFALSNPPVMTAGDQYTIRFAVPTVTVGWVSVDISNPYAGGMASSDPSWDFLFETYVAQEVPLLMDQRGSARPYDFSQVPNAVGGDGSDIGAVELGGVPVSP